MQKYIDDLQDNKKKFAIEINSKDNEIEKLKGKIKNIQDDENEQKSYISKLENDISIIPELNGIIDNFKLEIVNFNDLIGMKNQEIEELQYGLSNIQNVLEESQVSHH